MQILFYKMWVLPGQSPDILSQVSLHSNGHLFSHNRPKNPSGQTSLQFTPYFPGVHSIKKEYFYICFGGFYYQYMYMQVDNYIS